MKIPIKYQIFHLLTEVSDKDAQRLRVHLSGWNQLHEMFLLGINEADLRRLIILEMMGARRKVMLSRLLGRYLRTQREVYQYRIQRCTNTSVASTGENAS